MGIKVSHGRPKLGDNFPSFSVEEGSVWLDHRDTNHNIVVTENSRRFVTVDYTNGQVDGYDRTVSFSGVRFVIECTESP